MPIRNDVDTLQTATERGATTTRAVTFNNSVDIGTTNFLRFNSSARIFGNVANNIRFVDSTNVGGLDYNLTTTSTTINTVTQDTANIIFQNQTFAPAGNHSSIIISPTWAAENFTHRALAISPTQNGTNTQTLTGITLTMTKATGATTLANMFAIAGLSPVVAGTVTTSAVLFINDQTNASISKPYGIIFNATGAANSILWGNSANQYAQAANNIRFTDSTNVNGLDFNFLATAVQTIRTVSITTGTLSLQSQTFTPGAAHQAIQIYPLWASENFLHQALDIAPTQNGTNTNSLEGINITMNKATVATTLAQMTGIHINSTAVTGTVTSSNGIRIDNQTDAGVTTARAIFMVATGVANSIVWGASAIQYASAAETVRFADSTDVGGTDFLQSTTNSTIRTRLTTNVTLVLQNQTFTPAATHSATQIFATWTAENFQHTTLQVFATQNGTNTNTLQAASFAISKATGATTLDTARAVEIGAPVATGGTITSTQGINIEDQSLTGSTNSFAIRIASQTANATTTRAALIVGTGANNALQMGADVNIYSTGGGKLQFMDSTATRGVIMTVTAAGTQTIGSTAGALVVQSAGGSLAFFGTAGATVQAAVENVTNSVTVGGVNGTIADFAVTVAIDTINSASQPDVNARLTSIRNDIYQLARKMQQVNDSLRLYGLLS